MSADGVWYLGSPQQGKPQVGLHQPFRDQFVGSFLPQLSAFVINGSLE